MTKGGKVSNSICNAVASKASIVIILLLLIFVWQLWLNPSSPRYSLLFTPRFKLNQTLLFRFHFCHKVVSIHRFYFVVVVWPTAWSSVSASTAWYPAWYSVSTYTPLPNIIGWRWFSCLLLAIFISAIAMIVLLFLFGILLFILFWRLLFLFVLCRQLLKRCSNHIIFVSFGFFSKNYLPILDGPECCYNDVLDIRRPGRLGGFVQQMMVVIMHITWCFFAVLVSIRTFGSKCCVIKPIIFELSNAPAIPLSAELTFLRLRLIVLIISEKRNLMAWTMVSSHSHTFPCVALALIFSHALRMRRCEVDTMISWRFLC